jgi:hypothetical protein
MIINQVLDDDNYHIFTDGSKSDMGTGAAFVVFCAQRQSPGLSSCRVIAKYIKRNYLQSFKRWNGSDLMAYMMCE